MTKPNVGRSKSKCVSNTLDLKVIVSFFKLDAQLMYIFWCRKRCVYVYLSNKTTHPVLGSTGAATSGMPGACMGTLAHERVSMLVCRGGMWACWRVSIWVGRRIRVWACGHIGALTHCTLACWCVACLYAGAL